MILGEKRERTLASTDHHLAFQFFALAIIDPQCTFAEVYPHAAKSVEKGSIVYWCLGIRGSKFTRIHLWPSSSLLYAAFV